MLTKSSHPPFIVFNHARFGMNDLRAAAGSSSVEGRIKEAGEVAVTARSITIGVRPAGRDVTE